MEIRFEGLICHARLKDDHGTERDLAVMLFEPLHVAVLTVRHSATFSDIVSEHPPLQPVGSNPNVKCFRLKDSITTSLGSGLAVAPPLMVSPSLMDARVATGNRVAHSDARNRHSNAARYNAIFDLPPGGTYSVIAHFAETAIFAATDIGCVARTVRYAFAPTSDVRFNLQGGGAVVVKPNATVYITNKCNVHTPTGHFKANRHLFNGPTNVLSPAPGTPCVHGMPAIPHDECGGGAEFDVDCANSRFP